MKTTILGGILFLAPIAVIAVILGKAYQVSLMVAQPIDQAIPISSFLGVATVNLLAVVLILVVCFVAGLLAKRALFSNRLQRLDGLLIDLIPPYAIFKSILSGASSEENLSSMMTPVLVRLDDYEQIAFEIERQEEQSVLFLPGSPSAWSGSTIVADAHRVRYLNMPTHQAVGLLRTFGRGTLAARAAATETQSKVSSAPVAE